MEQNISTSPSNSYFNAQAHTELARGDWEALFKIATEWLQAEPGQPVATFIKNIACLFINPPAIIQNKNYLEKVKDKDWKAVLAWFNQFQGESDRHNPCFQAINFIIQPNSKKKDAIESALQEHPNNAELLFLQAISLRDHSVSNEKLKLALADKPFFPAALYLLGIFSLQLNQVEAAESYLKRAIEQAPDFLEAHYQLGSLYTQYIPNASEQAKIHWQHVIALDPEGEAGIDAKRVLEGNARPQYGQRISGRVESRRGGMSILTIIGISLLTVVLFSGPVASFLKITSPMIGILAGLFVFFGLYSAYGRKR